jgi:hypothetical protein
LNPIRNPGYIHLLAGYLPQRLREAGLETRRNAVENGKRGISFTVIVIVCLAAFGLGALSFVEYRAKSKCLKTGGVISERIKASGPAFSNVRVKYAVGPGIVFAVHKPLVDGEIATPADLERLKETVRAACEETGYDFAAVKIYVASPPPKMDD